MPQKRSTILMNFHNLRNVSKGYAGISFESISSVRHQHLDFYEIIIITNGVFEHTIGNTTTTLPAGTLLLLKPGVTHQLFTEPFKSTHFVICIEQHYFEQYATRFLPAFNIDEFDEYISKPLSKEKLKFIEYLGTKLHKNSRPTLSMADEILFLCISDFTYHNDTLDCDAYVAEIIQKLNNQVYMNTSIKDICSYYPYSQTMLLRQFKKLTGMTMVEYKAEQKLKYACQLLTNSEAKVIQIATLLEYNSLSHFLCSFKNKYGMTPSEYRKKHQK